jgi:hypothetical protein
MIDRIISGPLRSGLRAYVLGQAQKFAVARSLTLTIVTHPEIFLEWKKDLATVERLSHIVFMHGPPPADKRLYVVEVSRQVEERIGHSICVCEDPVWVMKYSC